MNLIDTPISLDEVLTDSVPKKYVVVVLAIVVLAAVFYKVFELTPRATRLLLRGLVPGAPRPLEVGRHQPPLLRR